jgi:hypothetical protein
VILHTWNQFLQCRPVAGGTKGPDKSWVSSAKSIVCKGLYRTELAGVIDDFEFRGEMIKGRTSSARKYKILTRST